MQMKTNRVKAVGAAVVAVAIVSAGSAAFAQVASQTVYDNTTTKTGQQYAPASGTQFGNQIFITAANPTANPTWNVTAFSFEYNSGNAVVGAPVGSAVVNFYANTGAAVAGPGSQAPSTVLYTSPNFNLTGTGNAGSLVSFSSLNVTVPPSFTWTVTFSSANGATLGLDTYGPVTTGTSYNDIWQKTATSWTLLQSNGTVNYTSFGSKFSAYPTPEPGTIALGLMGVLATGGMLFGKRKNA